MDVEDGQQLIRNNIKELHKIDKYENLSKALRGDNRASIRPKKLLYNALHFLEDKRLIPDKEHNRWCFFLTTDEITRLRGREPNEKYNDGVSNRNINYLAALGVINKMYQPFFMEYKEIMKLTQVNRNFMINSTYKNIPMNFFYLNPYTDTELQRLDARAERILKAKLTPGKQWSKATLQARGLEDLAEELYRRNRDVIAYKTSIYEYMCLVISGCIANKGYALKEDLCSNMLIDDETIENILRIFKPELLKIYNYKKPKKSQREIYKLENSNFIFTEKGDKE